MLSLSFFCLTIQIAFSYPLSTDPNDIQFILYKDKSNLNASQEIIYLNQSSLIDAGLAPNVTTVLVVHGYYDDAYDEETVQKVKNAYLTSGVSANLILVDWVKLSRPGGEMSGSQFIIGYVQVVLNVPILGKRLFEFFDWLLQSKIISSPKQLHLIGHSLGSHACGYSGTLYSRTYGEKKQIGRITGLDPAGPLVEVPIQLAHKLSYKDGQFVDIIHTNMGLFGGVGQDGHADFYPNGGIIAPGCSSNISDLMNIMSCSHIFALRLYAASFFNKFVGCQCPVWRFGNCESPCENSTVMGVYIPYTASGKFYLTTSANPMGS